MKCMNCLFLTSALALAFVGASNGQVIKGETPAGGFGEIAYPPLSGDLIPPEILLREPVVVTTRGLKPVASPMYSTHSATVAVRGVARDSSGIASVYVDGKEAAMTRQEDGIGFSANVPLLLGENRIDIIAVDRARQENKIAVIVNRETGLVRGKYYALLIAVEKYDDPRLESLANPVHDAESLKTVLIKEYEFEPTNVKILKNPDNRGIISVLGEYRKRLTRDDNLLIFYAGHGYWDAGMKQGYWLPANAKKDDPTEWLSNSTIRDYIRGIKTQHTLLIADACFSGSIFKERGAIRPDAATEQIYELPSRRAITSGLNTVPDESVFLAYLVKRLRENRDAYLTAEDLYVKMKVAVINASTVNQVPRYGIIDSAEDEGGDFVFTRR